MLWFDNDDNKPQKLKPGKLKCVQAIGWYLKESNLAQVSINLTDLETTGLHEVFEEVSNGAKVD